MELARLLNHIQSCAMCYYFLYGFTVLSSDHAALHGWAGVVDPRLIHALERSRTAHRRTRGRELSEILHNVKRT